MQDLLKGLNTQQTKAVTTDSQYVRVIAGAGSGKTRVLTTRIAYIINNWGIAPDSILAITFTNKAAKEMKLRIENLLDASGYGAHISTIHSFCVTFLRAEIRRENYPSNFTILDTDDQKSIIKEGYKILGLDSKTYNINQVLDYIGNHKGAGFTADEALNRAENYFYQNLARLYKYYEDRCHQLYGLDFDDLLLWTNKILKKFPTAREKWQKKFKFILVDEFQDIDNTQNELISLLCNDDTYLYVVGDPDQTIYSWRGADINIIMGFERKFPGSETIVLSENYRSTKSILSAANSLIENNKNRVKKDLFTNNPDGTKIKHFTASDDNNEALYVVRNIMDLTKTGKYSYKDCAVLYRNNYLSRAIEKKMMDLKIPYVIYGGVKFYERAEIKDMLSYLRMITSQDDLSFKRIVNTPKRGIGSKSVEDLFDVARKSGLTCYEAIEQILDPSLKSTTKFFQFKSMVDSWIKRSESMSIEEIFQMVLDESGYRKMLEESDDPKDEERLDNVKELLNDIIVYSLNYPDVTLSDYLGQVALYTDMSVSNDGDFVSLLTIHAAKGLEFKNVFIVGLSETIFPSARSMEESGRKGLEEERRLAYVAFTRAQENLFLSDNGGYNFNTNSGKTTSRFVNEIDSDLLIKVGVSEPRENTLLTSTSISSSASFGFNLNKKTKMKVGDHVIHDDFGEGIILAISEDGKFGEIAFPYPYKTKKLALAFPKLHKKELQA